MPSTRPLSLRPFLRPSLLALPRSLPPCVPPSAPTSHLLGERVRPWPHVDDDDVDVDVVARARPLVGERRQRALEVPRAVRPRHGEDCREDPRRRSGRVWEEWRDREELEDEDREGGEDEDQVDREGPAGGSHAMYSRARRGHDKRPSRAGRSQEEQVEKKSEGGEVRCGGWARGGVYTRSEHTHARAQRQRCTRRERRVRVCVRARRRGGRLVSTDGLGTSALSRVRARMMKA